MEGHGRGDGFWSVIVGPHLCGKVGMMEDQCHAVCVWLVIVRHCCGSMVGMMMEGQCRDSKVGMMFGYCLGACVW